MSLQLIKEIKQEKKAIKLGNRKKVFLFIKILLASQIDTIDHMNHA